MTDTRPASQPEDFDNRSPMARFLERKHGLAITYWLLYFVGVSAFFAFGSQAVDNGLWTRYLIMVTVLLAYTLALISGIRATYKGPQLWKVVSRTSSLFMIINILTAISTLGFIY